MAANKVIPNSLEMELIWEFSGDWIKAKCRSGQYVIFHVGRGVFSLTLPGEKKMAYSGDYEKCREYAEDHHLSEYFNY